MIKRLALTLFFLTILAPDTGAEDRTNNRELMRQVVTKLNEVIDDEKLERRDLTITLKDAIVTVTGRIEAPGESQLILESIVAAEGIRCLQLNLGIGHEPSPPCSCSISPKCDPDLWRRPLRWDDGDWQLDFGTQPIRHRTTR